MPLLLLVASQSDSESYLHLGTGKTHIVPEYTL